jgi:hypothetical protein
MMAESDQAAGQRPEIHIIDETEESLLLTVRVTKSTLVANRAVILALFELANLLAPNE